MYFHYGSNCHCTVDVTASEPVNLYKVGNYSKCLSQLPSQCVLLSNLSRRHVVCVWVGCSGAAVLYAGAVRVCLFFTAHLSEELCFYLTSHLHVFVCLCLHLWAIQGDEVRYPASLHCCEALLSYCVC